MNKYFRYTAFAFAVSIIAGGSLFFINDVKYQQCVTAIMLIVLLVALFCFLKYVVSAKQTIALQESKNRDDVAIILAKLEKSESLNKRYREVLVDLEKKQTEAQTKVSQTSCDMLKYFRDNIVSPYIAALKDVEMPLTPEVKQEIIDSTIDLAMKAVDVADAYEWSINNRPEQKLNLEVVSQIKTKEEAYDNARQITDNPTVTPKWIRAMSGSLKDVVSETTKIIYSGYKR